MTDDLSVLRVKLVTCPEVGALVFVLQQMQSLNFVPSRVMAQRVVNHDRTKEVLEIEIEVPSADLAPDAFRLFAAKINQLPTVLTAVAGK